MRISSELFPFASHDKYGYDLDYAAPELKVRTRATFVTDRELKSDCTQIAGDLANQYGHRMTLHPGQVGSSARILFLHVGSTLPSSLPKLALPGRTL
jgi:UV DNA damage repair endonuclease